MGKIEGLTWAATAEEMADKAASENISPFHYTMLVNGKEIEVSSNVPLPKHSIIVHKDKKYFITDRFGDELDAIEVAETIYAY